MALWLRAASRIPLLVVSGSVATLSIATGCGFGTVQSETSVKSQPLRPEYTFLICGAGKAGTEALRVLQENASTSQSILLVAPEAKSQPSDVNRSRPAFAERIGLKAATVPTDIRLHEHVVDIDPVKRMASLGSGEEVSFDKCLVAVGGSFPETGVHQILAPDAGKHVGFVQAPGFQDQVERVLGRPRLVNDLAPHFTVIGGSWSALCLGASLVGRGAAVTFSFGEPAFMARHFPKFMSQELLRRFKWASSGAVDTLCYSALKYITSEPIAGSTGFADGSVRDEAELHMSLVFDAYSLVSFRSDFVAFAPTILPAPPLVRGANLDDRGLLVCTADLAVYTDVYAAGSCVALPSGTEAMDNDTWSSERAIATGRHAALNMLGHRDPYERDLGIFQVDLSPVALRLWCAGAVDGGAETFSYFVRTRYCDDETSGGEFEGGIVFYVSPASNERRNVRVTGAVVWDGNACQPLDPEAARRALTAGLNAKDCERQAMQSFLETVARELLEISPSDTRHDGQSEGDKNGFPGAEDSPSDAQPSENEAQALRRASFWTAHRQPRSVPIRAEEVMWIADEKLGATTGGAPKDRRQEAFDALLRKSMSSK